MRDSDHFAEDGLEPLTDDEIDALCERLNLAPETPKRSIPQLSGAVGDFVRTAAAGNTDAEDLQRLACDLLGLEHPKLQDSYEAQQLEALKAKCDCGQHLYGIVRVHHCDEASLANKLKH